MVPTDGRGSPDEGRGSPGERRGRSGFRLGSWPVASLLALAGGALFGLGWWLRPALGLNAVTYGGERVHVINAHLRQAKAPFVFLAGDSFVEHYAPETLPCGRETVNGGINGAKVGDYLALLDRITFEERPTVVLLSTGLNDLLKKHDPTGPAALDRFRRTARALIGRLGQGGTRVVVAAIPPITDGVARYFDTASFELYTSTLREICAAQGCTLTDPFRAMREGPFWRGRPGTSRDGLHLANLRDSYRTIYDELCR